MHCLRYKVRLNRVDIGELQRAVVEVREQLQRQHSTLQQTVQSLKGTERHAAHGMILVEEECQALRAAVRGATAAVATALEEKQPQLSAQADEWHCRQAVAAKQIAACLRQGTC